MIGVRNIMQKNVEDINLKPGDFLIRKNDCNLDLLVCDKPSYRSAGKISTILKVEKKYPLLEETLLYCITVLVDDQESTIFLYENRLFKYFDLLRS